MGNTPPIQGFIEFEELGTDPSFVNAPPDIQIPFLDEELGKRLGESYSKQPESVRYEYIQSNILPSITSPPVRELQQPQSNGFSFSDSMEALKNYSLPLQVALGRAIKGITFDYVDPIPLVESFNPGREKDIKQLNEGLVGTIGEYSGLFLPLGATGKIGGLLVKQGLRRLPVRSIINQAVRKFPILEQSASGGLGFGLYEAAKAREGPMTLENQVDPLGRLQSGAEGAAIGAAFPFVLKGAGKIAKPVVSKFFPKKIQYLPREEAAALVRQDAARAGITRSNKIAATGTRANTEDALQKAGNVALKVTASIRQQQMYTQLLEEVRALQQLVKEGKLTLPKKLETILHGRAAQLEKGTATTRNIAATKRMVAGIKKRVSPQKTTSEGEVDKLLEKSGKKLQEIIKVILELKQVKNAINPELKELKRLLAELEDARPTAIREAEKERRKIISSNREKVKKEYEALKAKVDSLKGQNTSEAKAIRKQLKDLEESFETERSRELKSKIDAEKKKPEEVARQKQLKTLKEEKQRLEATPQEIARKEKQAKLEKEVEALINHEDHNVRGVTQNLREMIDAGIDTTGKTFKQLVDDEMVPFDEVKTFLSGKDLENAEKLNAAFKDAEKISIKYTAEITGRTDKVIAKTQEGKFVEASTDVSVLGWFRRKKGDNWYVGFKANNEKGFHTNYYLEETPEGSKLLEVGERRGPADDGIFARVGEEPKEVSVAKMLTRGERSKGLLTSEAKNIAGKFEEIFSNKTLSALPPELQEIIRKLKVGKGISVGQLRKMKKIIETNQEAKKVFCQLSGFN